MPELDDLIDAWHDGGGGQALHEYLGWTWEEYARWLRNPADLPR